MKKNKLKLWTSQNKIVLDTLEEKGVYHVKREFIEEKYEEVAGVFLEPYDWFVHHGRKLLAPPEGAHYPIWLFTDPSYVEKYEGSHILQIEVDKDKAILFDPKSWNRILNLSYLAKDEKDLEEYRRSLEDQGIRNEADIYMTSFYPLLKQRVRKSWERLFQEENTYQAGQAALWEIRGDWLVSID